MSLRRGLLIILSSPSGAGKSTLARRLRAWDPSIVFSVSATTFSRPTASEVATAVVLSDTRRASAMVTVRPEPELPL